ADFVARVQGSSPTSLGGARLVKAGTGVDLTDHHMGGWQVHCYASGVADNEVEDDKECLATVRRFLSSLPSSNTEAPPLVETDDPPERLVAGLDKIVPISPRSVYDVRKVIKAIFDHESWFEVKPSWAKNIVIGFARAAGHSVAVVANQPLRHGGVIDPDSTATA